MSQAACDLLQKLKATPAGCFVVIELKDLKGRDKIPDGVELKTVFQY